MCVYIYLPVLGTIPHKEGIFRHFVLQGNLYGGDTDLSILDHHSASHLKDKALLARLHPGVIKCVASSGVSTTQYHFVSIIYLCKSSV